MSTTVEQTARQLLSVEQARAQMLDGLSPLPAATVSLDDALWRVAAAELRSETTLPPWDNSAMDGFAVVAADVADATEATPVNLRVTGEVAAGAAAEMTVERGTAVRILTGAPVPAGADAVVPVENTDAQPGISELPERVSVMRPFAAGAHIRTKGSDLRAGQTVLEPGTVITPAAIAVAAAAGHARLAAHGRPRVAVLATGDELVPAGAPLGAAQIPDSNTPGLMAAARDAGAEVRSLGIARDSFESVKEALERGLAWADVIVASGGVSVGAHDVVKDAFAAVGRIDLWRIAVQPGKPLAFGRAPASGRPGNVLLFGLPGNPVSSLVTFELFVRPVLRMLGGQRDVIGRETVRATLMNDVRKAANRRSFIRVRLDRGETGSWEASLAGGQESHMLAALAAADGLAIIPEEVDSASAGTEVEVLRLR
jgi:molybdopterin molybdotransferase